MVYAHMLREGEEVSRVLILIFGELYSAHFFTNLLIGDDSWTEEKDSLESKEIIRTASNIQISMYGKDLFKVINYEPTELEAEWDDEQVRRHVSQFKFGRSQKEDPETVDEEGRPQEKRPKKEKKEKKPKIDKTGMITANDIAKELGVEGRDVRGVLRAMKLQKPEGGWAFDKKTAEEIREKVKKGLKEAKKKKGKK